MHHWAVSNSSELQWGAEKTIEVAEAKGGHGPETESPDVSL